jgi:ribonuclease Y
MDLQETFLEIEQGIWDKAEHEILRFEERIEDLEQIITEKKQTQEQTKKDRQRELERMESHVAKYESRVKGSDGALNNHRIQSQELKNEYIDKITSKINVDRQNFKQSIVEELIRTAENEGHKMVAEVEADARDNAYHKAERILDVALDRFQRPYCAERGIPPVNIPDERTKRVLMDSNHEVVKAIVEACGCDIVVEEEMTHVGVAGFDPVRREHTRRTLERLFKERRLDVASVQRIAQNTKQELFRQIKQDGQMIARELRQEDLHPEVKQIMGSLRYRYSFTQNQYFHCGEVGWLCGLLAQELGGVTHSKARRSGLLHDLGKAMDHALEGGHAVIGADFIQKRNESPDVVHAVRAHHFDEQPSTNMAYLVIAADAISGARPGARRSTIESYTQKVIELETITKSFSGVNECYVLSGGREVRVVVDSRRVDDTRALNLSSEIAKKIEADCNYPGQIKVVVVRETMTSETTRAH